MLWEQRVSPAEVMREMRFAVDAGETGDFFTRYGKDAAAVKGRAAAGRDGVLVAENQPRAVIVLAADADEDEKSAALFFRASRASRVVRGGERQTQCCRP